MLTMATAGPSKIEIRLFGRAAKIAVESMQTPIGQLSVVNCQLLRDKTPGGRRNATPGPRASPIASARTDGPLLAGRSSGANAFRRHRSGRSHAPV
jgi:hypothetical protein